MQCLSIAGILQLAKTAAHLKGLAQGSNDHLQTCWVVILKMQLRIEAMTKQPVALWEAEYECKLAA